MALDSPAMHFVSVRRRDDGDHAAGLPWVRILACGIAFGLVVGFALAKLGAR